MNARPDPEFNWPIIAICEGDIVVLQSADRVSWIEPVDVEEGNCLGAWDREGTRLALQTRRRTRRSLFGRLKAYDSTVVEEIPNAEPEDRMLDEEILKRLRTPSSDPSRDLRGRALVEYVLEHFEPA